MYTGGTYRITAADGTTTGDITSTTTPTHITVNDVNAASTTFTFYGASQSNWFGFTNFTITLTKPLALNVVGDKSYATLYLPVDVQTDADTKAYYIREVKKGSATLTEVTGGQIPANTAVVLINEKAATQTTLEMTSKLSQIVSEEDNLLKGTLVPIELDLSGETPNYSLGRSNGNIGFYKFKAADGTTTITLGANKAYLEVPSASSGSKGFTFSFGDIDKIVRMDNGQWTMDQVYDLQGRKISTLQKGVNIIRKSDGSTMKVIVK